MFGNFRDMKKSSTDCCALCQLSNVNNYTPKEEIEAFIKMQKKEALANNQVGVGKWTGQTAIFTIVSPGEDQLEANLLDLGFKHAHTFERRLGYPPGNLKFMIKNVI